MHELAVTQSLLQLALNHANGGRVTNLYLEIGQLSSFVDDTVQFYWDIISEGTPAQGAKLHFQRVPAEMECLDCEQRYRLSADHLACPNCDGTQVRLVSGDQFYLEAIDVEPESVEEIVT
jgi:hydrogenase nickel incorporation protein HypA/HybF